MHISNMLNISFCKSQQRENLFISCFLLFDYFTTSWKNINIDLPFRALSTCKTLRIKTLSAVNFDYLYIFCDRQAVSLYHNTSVWLDT